MVKEITEVAFTFSGLSDPLLVSHADFEVVIAAVFLARPPLAVTAMSVGALTLRVVELY